MYAVSACLVGICCRYDGDHRKNDVLIKNFGSSSLMPVCPEVLGGLAVPRPSCAIVGGNGVDVLNGNAFVVDSRGKDYTMSFVQGAYLTFERITRNFIFRCFFKSKSPSCGLGAFRDFDDGSPDMILKRRGGVLGVTAALVLHAGVDIIEIQ